MKRILLLFCISNLIYSCTETEAPLRVTSQVWNLTGYTCTYCASPDEFFPVSDTTYFYTINPDSSFSKTMGDITLNGQIEAKESQFGGFYYEFQYDLESVTMDEEAESAFGYIHYCGQDYEILELTDEGNLMGAWGACDGPNLVFERQVAL